MLNGGEQTIGHDYWHEAPKIKLLTWSESKACIKRGHMQIQVKLSFLIV